jgi:cytochrome P450
VASHRGADGIPLTRYQAAGLCYFLLVAGHQTTSQLLATALRRLIGDAELWQRLGHQTDGLRLAEACVEEVLRLEPAVTSWRRVLSRPVTLAGVDVPAGAQLLLMLAASGADETRFADPHTFDPMREGKASHLAFGYGRHFCLGAAAARTESAIVIATLARELPDLRLREDDPPHLALLSFNGPTRVLVTTS